MNGEEEEDEVAMLRRIDERLQRIEAFLVNSTVEQDCAKMRNHIDFVERVYETVRRPLNYIKNRFEYLMGPSATGTSIDLQPLIQDREE